jgi:hypothetical protein
LISHGKDHASSVSLAASDESSRAAALELEVARLATQLRNALGAMQRAEGLAASARAEVGLALASVSVLARAVSSCLLTSLSCLCLHVCGSWRPSAAAAVLKAPNTATRSAPRAALLLQWGRR